MNLTEAAALLVVIATYDRRGFGEPDAVAWQKALHDVAFDPARDAVIEHYRTSTDWLMPAHVRKLTITAANDSAMRALTPLRDDLVPMPDWFKPLYEKTLAEERAKGTYAQRGPLADAMDDVTKGWI